MKLKPTLLLALSGLAAWAAPGAAASGRDGPACSTAAFTGAGTALRSARTALAAVPAGPMEVDVSADASRRIEAVKDRLRTLVQARLECLAGVPEPEAIEPDLAKAGGAAAASAPSADRQRHALGYDVQRVPGHPELLAVVATLGIECGTDSMLMLYQRREGRWREVMVRRSPPYRKISGGWQDLRFAVSPPDAGGGWFVATVSTTPWCTSAWRNIRYALSRPGPAADRPLVFLHGEAGDYMGDESDVLVKAERDSFELRNNAGSLDPEILIRRHVRRYSVRGNETRRVQPVAETVRDFADEWVDSPWAEARDWSASAPALAASHAGLQAARWKSLAGFASIRACAGGTTQVEIAETGAGGWFLIIRGGASGPWTMERVVRRAASECGGPDRLGKD